MKLAKLTLYVKKSAAISPLYHVGTIDLATGDALTTESSEPGYAGPTHQMSTQERKQVYEDVMESRA
jgi:hypothetical protein